MLSMTGLIGGFIVLSVMTLRGWNLFIAAPFCSLIVALSAGLTVLPMIGLVMAIILMPWT
ncbi:MAG: hypothetical protein AAF699_11970 [Pseudomonadota bacterium]